MREKKVVALRSIKNNICPKVGCIRMTGLFLRSMRKYPYYKYNTIMLPKDLNISQRELVFFMVTVLLTAFIIFFTPLRYTILVEPKIKDADPEKIYMDMTQNPDNYLFIDVRTAADYKKLHAKGSINIPIAQFYDKWREFPRTGKEIVLICGGGRLSGVAFFFLQHFGFTNIVHVPGGIDNWVLKNLPVILQETST